MTAGIGTEDLLRRLAPRVLGSVTRRFGDFADAEDAVQEALVAAAAKWPATGVPDDPLAWLVAVASRRMVDHHRRDAARRRRETLAAGWALARPDPAPSGDDTLTVLFMCCHPSLRPGSAVPLTLRAVGGLSTREIARAFLVPEATMAQRISRAKAKVRASGAAFTFPSAGERPARLASVLSVLYLVFNEGYATSGGPDLARVDLSTEAMRLTRDLHDRLPDDPEVTALLALMLLTDARRPARTGPGGELVPLADQDRGRWDRRLIAEGTALATDALGRGPLGEYQVQAAIAALHDEAARYDDTDWVRVLALYEVLDRLTGNPMVSLNRAVATAMVRGPRSGLEVVDGLGDDLADHHRRHAVRAHLLEMDGDREAALVEFRAAAAGTRNLREQQYLMGKAAALGVGVSPQAPRPEAGTPRRPARAPGTP